MRISLLFLTVLGVFLSGCATVQQLAPVASPVRPAVTDRVAVVREAGWKTVCDILPHLEKLSPQDCPDLTALAADLRAVDKEITVDGLHDYRRLKVERLIDGNPRFWRAYLEVFPGDPVFLSLHAGLLMSAGEVTRAYNVLTLAVSFARVEPSLRLYLLRLETMNIAVYATEEPILAHWRMRLDAGDRRTVRRECEAALEFWPQDVSARACFVRTDPTPETIRQDRQEIKRHDPLLQSCPGEDPVEAAGLAEARQLFGGIASGQQVGDDGTLADFSEKCRQGGAMEAAFVARQLLSGRKGFYSTHDEPFWQDCLQVLAGTKETAGLMGQFHGQPKALMVFVLPNGPQTSSSGGLPLHPVLAEKIEVNIAESTFLISLVHGQKAAMAEAYEKRAYWLGVALRTDEAVSDLSRAAELAPDPARNQFDLAITLCRAGRSAEAEAAFDRALQIAPDDAFGLYAYGIQRFAEGSYNQAGTIFARVLTGRNGFVQAAIMQHLAELRQGRTNPLPLEAALTAKRTDLWHRSLLQYLAGHIDRDTLLGCLPEKGGLERSEQECQLDFVLGEQALAAGDKDEAQRDFHLCVDTGAMHFLEYTLARAELARLAPPVKPGEKKAAPPAGDGEPSIAAEKQMRGRGRGSVWFS